MKVRIIRIEESDQGTVGVMLMGDVAFCCTLEPPDRGNQKNISCIPVGHYSAIRNQSPKYGDTFMISGVPGRSHVLFHSGNVVKHTKGCVLLGQYFGKLRGNRAVLNSGKTFKKFLNILSGKGSFDLEIVEV